MITASCLGGYAQADGEEKVRLEEGGEEIPERLPSHTFYLKSFNCCKCILYVQDIC